MSTPQTPQGAVIAYYEKGLSFDVLWNFVQDRNMVEAFEIQHLLQIAAETRFNEVKNKQNEMAHFAGQYERALEKVQWEGDQGIFSRNELKKFLKSCRHIWKTLGQSLQDKLEEAWEMQSMNSALMDVLGQPRPKSSRSQARSQRGASKTRRVEKTQQRSSPQVFTKKLDPNVEPKLLEWMELAESKPWGKQLMKRWKSQPTVMDSLILQDIDDDVLQSFDVPKLQRVVLLKWKDQVLSGDGGKRGRSVPSRSADRYRRSTSAYRRRQPAAPQSHLYPPSRSQDNRRYVSRSQGRRSASQGMRSTPRKPKDPLVELFSRFDTAGNGYVEQSQLHVLMFSTLLVHRQRQIEENPNLVLPTKEEIRPKVNSLVWDVLKQVDLKNSNFISLNEYLSASQILLTEWKKSLNQASTPGVTSLKGVDEDSDDDDTTSPRPKQTQHNERAVGQELMIQVVKLCKVWNEKQGTTQQLIQYLKQTLQNSEKKLENLNQTNI